MNLLVCPGICFEALFYPGRGGGTICKGGGVKLIKGFICYVYRSFKGELHSKVIVKGMKGT